jgi:hypothetical protein
LSRAGDGLVCADRLIVNTAVARGTKSFFISEPQIFDFLSYSDATGQALAINLQQKAHHDMSVRVDGLNSLTCETALVG